MKEEPPKTFEEQLELYQKKFLSFEEFFEKDERGDPPFNNFFCFFIPGFGYEKIVYYQKLFKEHPDLVKSLSEKMKTRDILNAESRPKAVSELKEIDSFGRDFYEAYKIMRGYGANNTDLGVVPHKFQISK